MRRRAQAQVSERGDCGARPARRGALAPTLTLTPTLTPTLTLTLTLTLILTLTLTLALIQNPTLPRLRCLPPLTLRVVCV